MRCSETGDLALLASSGELEEGARSELEAHLTACPACRTGSEELREATFLRPPVLPAPPLLLQRRRRLPLAAAAAALLTVVLLAPPASRRPSPPVPTGPASDGLDEKLLELASLVEETRRDLRSETAPIDRELDDLRLRINTLEEEPR